MVSSPLVSSTERAAGSRHTRGPPGVGGFTGHSHPCGFNTGPGKPPTSDSGCFSRRFLKAFHSVVRGPPAVLERVSTQTGTIPDGDQEGLGICGGCNPGLELRKLSLGAACAQPLSCAALCPSGPLRAAEHSCECFRLVVCLMLPSESAVV